MGRILIIEGHPILREALRQFLFPEHQTVTRERWPGPEDIQQHDLVIVDHETIEQGGGATAEVLRSLQRLKIPSIWLHQGAPPSLKPGKLTATVAKPLERSALDTAVNSLLGASVKPGAGARPAADEPPAPEPPADERPGEAEGIIELTEVVEGSREPEIEDEN